MLAISFFIIISAFSNVAQLSHLVIVAPYVDIVARIRFAQVVFHVFARIGAICDILRELAKVNDNVS